MELLRLNSLINAAETTIAEGPFSGRKFRYTTDNPRKVSVIDWIVMYTGLNAKSSAQILRRIADDDETVASKLKLLQFPGERQRPTPVAGASDLIYILGKLPSRYTESFQHERDVLVARYLGGDTSISKEVNSIREAQQQLSVSEPDHPIRVFGEAVEAGEIGNLSNNGSSSIYVDERNEQRAHAIDEYHEQVNAMQRNPEINQRAIHIKVNAEVSRASLGEYPREFRRRHNLNRRESARSYMDATQLHSVALGATAARNIANANNNQTSAEFTNQVRVMTQRLYYFNQDYGIHGDRNMPRLTTPQRRLIEAPSSD